MNEIRRNILEDPNNKLEDFLSRITEDSLLPAAANPQAGAANLRLVQWDDGEDIHVTWADGRRLEELRRPGDCEPFMRQTGVFRQFASDPEVQWQDSWFISYLEKAQDIVWSLAQLCHVFHLPSLADTRLAMWHGAIDSINNIDPEFFDSLPVPKIFQVVKNTRSYVKDSSIRVTEWAEIPVGLSRLQQWPDSLPTADYPMPASVVTLDSLVRRGTAAPEFHLRELAKWLLLLSQQLQCGCHLESFRNGIGSGLEIVGHQGHDDLSLNRFHILYQKNQSLKALSCDLENPDAVFFCLVKHENESGSSKYSFSKAKISDASALLLIPSSSVAATDRIDPATIQFAAGGKPIVWEAPPEWRKMPDKDLEREILDFLVDNAFLYSDIRHLLELPSLNPKPDDTPPGFRGALLDRPRMLFGEERWDDVWLGEYWLAQSPLHLQAALRGQVEIPKRDLGASSAHIRAALFDFGGIPKHYECWNERYAGDPLVQLPPGCYYEKTDELGRLSSLVIRYRLNSYPLSVLAWVGDDPAEGVEARCLLSAVWHGRYSDRNIGFPIPDFAKLLIRLGVTYAILYEEGGDAYLSTAAPRSLAPRRRKRPSLFVFTHRS